MTTAPPGPEETMATLRARLQEQCRVPALPCGWGWSSATLSAEGLDFGGDFFVADMIDLPDGPGLQMVLVDVCGNGARALPAAVQLAGALRGLVTVLPYDEVMAATSKYLNSLGDPESFATAVQVVISLTTGHYEIRNAGHPPVLRWDGRVGAWIADTARGMALGIQDDPHVERSRGRLRTGEGLLFYTDGVVETRSTGYDVGVEWLRDVARHELELGWAGMADRLIARVSRGADDRAVLLLTRASGI